MSDVQHRVLSSSGSNYTMSPSLAASICLLWWSELYITLCKGPSINASFLHPNVHSDPTINKRQHALDCDILKQCMHYYCSRWRYKMYRLLYLTQHDFIFTVTSRVESTSITVNMSVIVTCFSAAGGCIVPLFITPIHFLTKSVGGFQSVVTIQVFLSFIQKWQLGMQMW